MSAFAIYRLPYADHCIKVEQTDGEPAELLDCRELNGRQGFVVAPFQTTPDQPILLIRPDRVASLPIDHLTKKCQTLCEAGNTNLTKCQTLCEVSPSYATDFANFHAQIEQGTFSKIVLARCADEPAASALPMTLFQRACQAYPRMFIALVSTTRSGLWLTATPEILLDGDGSSWRTIALAGTMRLEGEQLAGEGETVMWSTKNIQEQRIVATYIAECLERFTFDFREEGPRTVRAANLVHLRSDFTFTLPDRHRLGDLLHELHPTPAVCGLPKREAFDFIVGNEHTPRRYYSGFMGPLGMGYDTHLYVSLRCMNIGTDCCHLYAGGGILRDSTEQQEWQETEAKLETMRILLYKYV